MILYYINAEVQIIYATLDCKSRQQKTQKKNNSLFFIEFLPHPHNIIPCSFSLSCGSVFKKPKQFPTLPQR